MRTISSWDAGEVLEQTAQIADVNERLAAIMGEPVRDYSAPENAHIMEQFICDHSGHIERRRPHELYGRSKELETRVYCGCIEMRGHAPRIARENGIPTGHISVARPGFTAALVEAVPQIIKLRAVQRMIHLATEDRHYAGEVTPQGAVLADSLESQARETMWNPKP